MLALQVVLLFWFGTQAHEATTRFIADHREKLATHLAACTSDDLDRYLERMMTAETLDDVFGDLV